MNEKPKIWLYLFAIAALVNICAEFINSTTLIFISKPLLMPLLCIYFYKSTKLSTSYFKYIFFGFVLSFFGDTFLMFVENDPEQQIFFLLGLGSFLLTHLFYAIAFIKYNATEKGFIQKNWWIVFLFLAYLIGNCLFLWSDIPDDLKIPVVVYSSAIIMMVATCLNLYGKMPMPIFKILLIGVLLFLLSDSIIGLNKFKSHEFPIPYARLLIMIPYILSQYLIAESCIKLLPLHRK